MSDEDDDSKGSPVPEKCFYASFKIYLNPDSRKNSESGSDTLDDLISGTGEVVRIEKTLEVSDDNISDEDDKTLSLSNENILDPSAGEEETDNDEDYEMKMFAETMPKLVEIDTHLDRKRSVSESEDLQRTPQMSLRNSRSHERNGSSRRRESRYESTQSMDRYQRDRSPVFYLHPTDWIRTEGFSPLPYKEKQTNPMKLLDTLGINLDILTESEENLNSELEMKNIRNKSDPVRYQTPTLELIRESSKTPEPPSLPRISRACTPGIRSRSSTPGPSMGKTLLDRQRKTAIPILCSRTARMTDYLSPCASPLAISPAPLPPGPRSSDVESLGLFHNSKPGSSCGRLSRGMNYRSLSNLGRSSQEDVTRSKFGGGMAFSSGNLLHLGKIVLSLLLSFHKR
eukprot:GFUD01105707.1.p1 GENE.GFUD01105707.1~~GFUD01105707.1.p1  ORF type:complete len:399 (+),score=101.17 GFUD01105707.1:161-1357(+)